MLKRTYIIIALLVLMQVCSLYAQNISLNLLREKQPKSALAITADVLGGVAIAAAATAVVLVFFTDWDGGESEPDSAGVAVTPTFGAVADGMSLGLVGRF